MFLHIVDYSWSLWMGGSQLACTLPCPALLNSAPSSAACSHLVTSKQPPSSSSLAWTTSVTSEACSQLKVLALCLYLRPKLFFIAGSAVDLNQELGIGWMLLDSKACCLPFKSKGGWTCRKGINRPGGDRNAEAVSHEMDNQADTWLG